MKQYGDHHLKFKTMLFDTTVPNIQNYTAPQTPKFSGNEKTLMSVLGYNDEGNRNTWGKIASFTPAFAVGSNLLSKQFIKDEPQELQDSVKLANQQKLQEALAGAQVAAGVGLSIAGLPNVGVPMAISGVGQGVRSFGNNREMKDGGYIPGGSHRSGNDIALVHAKTGQDTGIRVEGAELLFSKENTEQLKEAIKNNDHKKLLKIVKSQLKNGTPKMEHGEMEFGGGGMMPYMPQEDNNINWNNYLAYGNFAQPIQLQEQSTFLPNIVANDQVSQNVMALDNPMANQQTLNGLTTQPTNTNWSTGLMYGSDASMPMSNTSLTAPTSGNSMGNYWNYIPGIAQTAIGLSNVNKKIPTITEPAAYANYISRLAQMSNQGYTPEERAYIDRDIKGTYDLGLNKAAMYSGGNSAAVQSTLGELGRGMNEAKLRARAEEAGLKRQNLLNYGSALGTETQLFNLPNQEWAMKYALMNKEAAANLANTGLTNVQSAATYNNLYNSPEYLALIQAYKNKAAQ